MAPKSVSRHVTGMDEQLGPRLSEGEADLALAVEVDDRVLHGAEPGQGDRQDHGVDSGGQLPGDDGAGGDAQVVEAGGDPLDPIPELAAGDHLAIGSDEQWMVR